MKHSNKKLIDLKKRASRPLVVRRTEKMHRNILQLQKISAQRSTKIKTKSSFDFRKKKGNPKNNSIYLVGQRKSKGHSRLKIIAATSAFVLILNFVGVIGSSKRTLEKTVSVAFSSLNDLVTASESFAAGDFTASQNSFAKAVIVLAEIENDLAILSGAGAVLETQTEDIQTGSRLISAGKLIGESGEKFAIAANEISLAFSNWEIRQQAVSAGESVESFSAQLTSPIRKILAGFVELENANTILQLVDSRNLPKNLQSKVSDAINKLNYFLDLAQPLTSALPEVPNLLGNKTPRRYLLLFQNSDEIRPTGGFIGSVGILDLNDGFVSKFEIKDIYEIDGQLAEHLDPPEGFGFITGSWGLRDANYHADFPITAEAADFLFEKAGFGSVDGVAAINSTLLTKIVALANGVQIDRLEEKITADDLNLALEIIIESKVDGASAPKKILEEIWANLSKEITEISKRDLLILILNALHEKEIQFSSANSDLQKIATATGLSNEMQSAEGDYLFVVNTSLSGNKSDKFCENEITHSTEISVDGETIDEVRILRKHDWSESAEQRMENLATRLGISLNDNLKEILGRGRNVNLVKIFVPFGAKLISVEGIEQNRVETATSAGKTYFMFSLTTQPKFSREVILEYRLPQKFFENYSFLGEFQSGDRTREIEKNIKFDDTEIFDGTFELGNEKNWAF